MPTSLGAVRGLPASVRIVVATLALVAAYAFQIPIEREVPGEPFLLFFLIVIVLTLACGEGVGLYGVGLSSFLSVFFFEPGTLALEHASDLIKIELYALLASGSAVGFARLGAALVASQETARASVESEKNKSAQLRELAHRVANNFAVVAGLIRTKAAAVSDPAAKSILDEAIDQVTVMARVHRHLLGDEEGSWLDSERFISELCRDLKASIARDRKVSIECVAISRPLLVAQAIPLGLIANELITNTVKYAFTDGRWGTIHVSLQELGDELQLAVEDDGVGFDGEIQANGKGLDLVRAFCQQLGGKLELRSGSFGSLLQVTFPRQKLILSTMLSHATSLSMH